MVEYEATTTNATNKVTAVPVTEGAEIKIELNGTEIDNESSAAWEDGENELVVTVTTADEEKSYTVTVTKS